MPLFIYYFLNSNTAVLLFFAGFHDWASRKLSHKSSIRRRNFSMEKQKNSSPVVGIAIAISSCIVIIPVCCNAEIGSALSASQSGLTMQVRRLFWSSGSVLESKHDNPVIPKGGSISTQDRKILELNSTGNAPFVPKSSQHRSTATLPSGNKNSHTGDGARRSRK